MILSRVAAWIVWLKSPLARRSMPADTSRSERAALRMIQKDSSTMTKKTPAATATSIATAVRCVERAAAKRAATRARSGVVDASSRADKAVSAARMRSTCSGRASSGSSAMRPTATWRASV